MATVTICRSSAGKARTLEGHVRRADVLVAAMGKAEAIAGSCIKEGAVVIDVGIHMMGEKTVGDVEFETARRKASAITPVPGGVGPVTTAILVTNLIRASLAHRSNDAAKRK
jgi:methylenetetrahydrofolate dehydrogenase (NADP+)/methenyltetrahydrofolate cyclohydrolase